MQKAVIDSMQIELHGVSNMREAIMQLREHFSRELTIEQALEAPSLIPYRQRLESIEVGQLVREEGGRIARVELIAKDGIPELEIIGEPVLELERPVRP